MKIVKRDGKIVNYEREKIAIAINKANLEVPVNERIESKDIENIILHIEGLNKKRMLVEDIQDIIEHKLMEFGKYQLAKKYIVYRYTRMLVRKKNTMDESILSLIKRSDEKQFEINPNKNAILASTQRDLIAGEVSKDLTKRILLPTKIAKAHEDGDIYFHDSDYFLQAMIDCSYLNLKDMLENGTVINNKLIETPKTFLVACLVTTQIIDSIACNQYGGVSIDISHLAKYLNKSIERYTYLSKEYHMDETTKESYVNNEVNYELTMGIQLIQYQLNTLMTTNGQYPSVTFFLQTNVNEYEKENALIIEELLKQRKTGIKNGNGEYITPRFPKLIYVLDESNTFNDGKYDYLTKLAVSCSKNGGYPDYVSSKMMKKYYKNNLFSPIGEHSLLLPYFHEGEDKFEGRFNIGLVTLNVSKIAILSGGNEAKFWSLLDDQLDLAREALMCKYYSLLSTTSDTSPLHWIYGGISRLTNGDYIDTLLMDGYANISLGVMGTNEACYLLKEHDNTSVEGHNFILKIIKRIKNTIDKWKTLTGIGFSLYSHNDLNVSYYFANKDKNSFGNIERITDKGYYSNCVNIESKTLSLIERLNLEKDFDQYFNGGSNHKIDISILNNEKESIEIIKYIYDNLLYTSFDVKIDKCKVCGYKGRMLTTEKHELECPNCTNKDKTKFHIYKKLNE